METKIGILYICTGNYTIFWKDFYLSMEKNFINDYEKHYFVFTNNKEIDFENENSRIHKIYQEDLGWPDNTLKRFHVFLKHEKELLNMNYLFFFNANLLVLENITKEEFLPINNQNLVATLHPGFYNKNREKFTYENNKKSTAYIAKEKGVYYFAGGLNGGKTIEFLNAMKNMKENTDIDIEKKIIAKWHDESHWNKYLIGQNDIKILGPEYLCPEGWDLPFKQKILIRDKNNYGGHNTLRKKQETATDILIKKIRNLITKIKKNIPNISKLLFYKYKKALILDNGIEIFNKNLLLTTIAFNNLEILKIQYQQLKKNLKDEFIYMIADNSSILSISEEIKNYCVNEKIPYVKLPPNPYKNPSKSHGIALNWVYKNVIKKYDPHFFGFLDHDIFPYKETSIIPYIQNNVFGLIQERENKWYLWAGFCFYDFKNLKKINMNFLPSKGLDTGGSNYYILYKDINKNNFKKLPQIYIDTKTENKVSEISNSNTTTTIECIGDWIHLMRISNWNEEKNNKTDSIEKIISLVQKTL